VPPLEAMADRAQGRASGSRGGIAGALVVAQVALSLVLLAGAGLFVRTFATLADRDLGFERDRALVVGVDAQRTGLDSAALLSLYEQVRDAALAVPGVSHAALSVMTPVSGDTRNWGIELPGRAPFPERERYVMMNLVSPGWFATMGTPLVAGRDFDKRDRAGSPRAMIVNQAFVARYLAGDSPVGRTILEERRPTADPRPMEIVGVVGDAVYESAREAPPPTMYWPLLQMRRPQSGVTLTVRASATSPASLAHSVGAAVLAVHPDLALSFRPFQGIVDASLAQERLVATLSGYFGALALLLAALGLYGVTAYTVSRRRFELGIRMALGATPGGVLRLVLARVALLVGGGLAAGAAVVWWASPLVASLLYAVGPHDLFTLGAAFAVLAAVGLVAGWLPALRAARTDPARVLREA
jgi:putative ABC transport system permease protein